MHDAAAIDGVELLLISAFRSIEFQAALVRDKLARGITIDEILMVNAPPGYSEHHSGRAIDIGARGIAPLDRKSVVWGKSVSVRLDLGGRRYVKKKKRNI